jgi:serralysin
MLFDIAALQYLYGATAASASDTTYDLSRPEYQTGLHTVWDAGGSDTFDASRITHAVTLDLRMGGRSDVGAVVAAQSVSRDGTAVNSSYTNTLTLAQAVVIERAVGTAFGDRFFGNASDNVLDGAGGLDTVVYSGSVSSYEVERAATGFAVRSQAPSAAKTDTLRNIERLEFLDGKLALDLDGNAGVAAKLLGAVFGADAVHNPRFVGIALSLLDGGMGAPTLAQLALDVRLGANAGAGAVADLLLANVGADGAQRAEWTVMLESGQASAAGLALQVADLPGNIERIGLVGLAEHGLAYAQ